MDRPIRSLALWNYHESLNRGFMLNNRNVTIGDDLLLPIVELAKALEANGVRTATLDMMPDGEFDACLFIDMPDMTNAQVKRAFASGKPLYLLALESPLVRPENGDPALHAPFARVFTYNDALVDGEKYVKVNYSFEIPQSLPKVAKEKLCVTIAGNKKPKVKGACKELYSERIRAIRWFEEHHPEDFDLYGVGWGRPQLKLSRVLNPFKLVKILNAPTYATYRGTVERKRPVLSRYKFSICYENVADVPGYITEKIFDCFFAGTVPVYLGAGNVTDHVPADCFIDKRDFPDYPSLYRFLAELSGERYYDYLAAIERFLQSDKAQAFTCRNFARVISGEILNQGGREGEPLMSRTRE